MRGSRLGLLLGCAAVLTSGVALGATRSWSDDASLLVDVHGGQSPGLELSFDFADRPPPGRITLYVPKGFDVYPQRPVAFPVGIAAIEAGNSSYGSFSDASFLGQITAASLDSPLAAAAQACGPGDAVALWKLSFTLLGLPVDVPIAIGATGPGDPPDAGLRIDVCPPTVPGADPAPVVPMESLTLVFSYIPPPQAPGSYTWHAVVTPVTPDGHTLSPTQAYELRSTYAVPHTLTLAGRRANGFAVLSGRLTADGRPQVHQDVYVTRLVRKIVRGRIEFLDSPAGERTTDAAGRYTLRVPLRATSGFVAATEESYERCAAPAYAPAGCVSATMPGTESVPITLSVAKPAR